MPVSGLLLTIDERSEADLRSVFAGDARTLAGDRIGARLTLALTTPNKHADEVAWQWLSSLPGVRWIDLVWISLDQLHEGEVS